LAIFFTALDANMVGSVNDNITAKDAADSIAITTTTTTPKL
jgi:hypothetical protein